jgi:carboxymethylenebutenolidase
MREDTLDIVTNDGEMETFICRPERGGPYPAILFLMDAPGIREELHDMARRLATVGYYVLLPNLYYRAGRDTKYGPDVLEKGSADHTAMRAIRTKMTIPPVMEDIAAMLAFIDASDEVKPGAVGAHGYCMSGPYALAAAARYPDRIRAAASFYGTWLVSDAEELNGLFKAAGTAGELEIHPGVHHGFAFPGRWCYDKPAAERHWERLFALYRRMGEGK